MEHFLVSHFRTVVDFEIQKELQHVFNNFSFRIIQIHYRYNFVEHQSIFFWGLKHFFCKIF